MVEANMSDHNTSVCRLLQSSVLKFCQENYHATADIEVDAIICLSPLNSTDQNVIKIHQILPKNNFKYTNNAGIEGKSEYQSEEAQLSRENRLQIFKKRRKSAAQRRNLNFSSKTGSFRSMDAYDSQGFSKRKSNYTLRIPSVSYLHPQSKTNSSPSQKQIFPTRSSCSPKNLRTSNGHGIMSESHNGGNTTSHILASGPNIVRTDEEDTEALRFNHIDTELEEDVDRECREDDDRGLRDANIPEETSATFHKDSYVMNNNKEMSYDQHPDTSYPSYLEDQDLAYVNGNLSNIPKQRLDDVFQNTDQDRLGSASKENMYLSEHGVLIKTEPLDDDENSSSVMGSFPESEKFSSTGNETKANKRRKRKQTPKQIIRKDDNWNQTNKQYIGFDKNDSFLEDELEDSMSTEYKTNKIGHTPRLASLLKRKLLHDSPNISRAEHFTDMDIKPPSFVQQTFASEAESQEYLWDAADDSSMDMADVESIKKTANSGKISMFLNPERKKRSKPDDSSNEDKNFFCSKCGTGFRSKKSKMRHEKYTCGDLPNFECFVCGKFYSRADSKTRHLWKIHGIKVLTPDKSFSVNSSFDEERLVGSSLVENKSNEGTENQNDSIVEEQDLSFIDSENPSVHIST